jgi:hypothetical protein
VTVVLNFKKVEIQDETALRSSLSLRSSRS